MAQKKKEDLDSLKKRMADQISGALQKDWTSPEGLVREWSEDVKRRALKNVYAVMGIGITSWGDMSFEKGTEFWRQTQEAAKPFVTQIFLDLQPQMAEAVAKKRPKINKTVLSLVTSHIDERLEELVQSYVKNNLDDLVKAEACRVADAWFARSIVALSEPLDEET